MERSLQALRSAYEPVGFTYCMDGDSPLTMCPSRSNLRLPPNVVTPSGKLAAWKAPRMAAICSSTYFLSYRAREELSDFKSTPFRNSDTIHPKPSSSTTCSHGRRPGIDVGDQRSQPGLGDGLSYELLRRHVIRHALSIIHVLGGRMAKLDNQHRYAATPGLHVPGCVPGNDEAKASVARSTMNR